MTWITYYLYTSRIPYTHPVYVTRLRVCRKPRWYDVENRWQYIMVLVTGAPSTPTQRKPPSTVIIYLPTPNRRVHYIDDKRCTIRNTSTTPLCTDPVHYVSNIIVSNRKGWHYYYVCLSILFVFRFFFYFFQLYTLVLVRWGLDTGSGPPPLAWLMS